MGPARSIDHLVLPVESLAVSRQRYAALGFSVAGDAQHPFGTENACVFLADGTYLEPLAVASREACLRAVAEGNVFVARDQAFRFRIGQDGFSALVLKTTDAAADDALYRDNAILGGPMLSFSRPVKSSDGVAANASFALAFAADLRSPDFFFFACERVNAPPFPVSRHANAVTGLKRIVLTETNPSDFQYLAETLLRQRHVRAHSFGIDLMADNCEVSIMTAEGIAGFYGMPVTPAGRGLRGAGIVFRTEDLGLAEKCLVDSGVSFARQAERIVVPPAPGQGAFFVIEEET